MYDVVIIGAGPAGLTAGIYTCRLRLKSLLMESQNLLSQLLFTDKIENYPGFPKGISGFSLLNKFRKQAEHFGLEFLSSNVKFLKKEEKIWVIETEDKAYKSKAVIVATGGRPKRLDIEGEDKFLGKGVSYCAVCDAQLFKEKDIVVIGGGDTATEEALFLVRFAKKVYLIHRRNSLRATKILEERLFSNKKIEVIWDSVVEEILGEKKVEKIKVKNLKTNEKREILCSAVFIAIGFIPNTEIFKNLLDLDESGYIITNENMQTSEKGIFACGDCRKKTLRQILTAVSDGAIAAISCQKYIEELEGV